MATAKRLPSGSYRARVYSHTENGKKVYESFTAPTKSEAEMLASEWANKKSRRSHSDLTVGEAIDGYIKAKEGVLSPSTYREYVRCRNNDFKSIESMRIRKITSADMQTFISELSKDKSAKYVRNVWGLLRPSIALYEPDITFRVTLPTRAKKRPVSPSDEDVTALLQAAKPEMKLCIALAAFGLRRGEICALKYEDIKGNKAHVHADMVKDNNHKWVYKEIPKTSESDRYIMLSDSVIEMIGSGEGFITKLTPEGITHRFITLRKKLKLSEHIRFHDMRHYFASIAVVLGVPDTYLADFGGWQRGSSVMKKIYQNNIVTMSDVYASQMANHIGEVIKYDTKYDTEFSEVADTAD